MITHLKLSSFFNDPRSYFSSTEIVFFNSAAGELFLTCLTKLSGKTPTFPFSFPFHQPGSSRSLVIISMIWPDDNVLELNVDQEKLLPGASSSSSSLTLEYGNTTSHNSHSSDIFSCQQYLKSWVTTWSRIFTRLGIMNHRISSANTNSMILIRCES